MKTLEAILTTVKEALAGKKKEIDISKNEVITYTKDDFKNREMEVFSFENSITAVTADAGESPEIIAKFKNEAQELIVEINKIQV